MAQIERKVEIHDENGFVELQTILVPYSPEIQSVEEMISQKEEQLRLVQRLVHLRFHLH